MITLEWISHFSPLVPGIFLLCLLMLVMLSDLFSFKNARVSLPYVLTQVALCGTFGLYLCVAKDSSFGWWAQKQTFMAGQFVSDRLGLLLSLSVCFAGILILGYGRAYHRLNQIIEGEFYALAMVSILGALVLISAQNLLSLYLGLELLSLPLYAMIAIRRERLFSVEAGMKYFVMGAVASAFLLYGFSLIYGISGSFDLTQIAAQLPAMSLHFQGPLLMATLFVLLAIGFKWGIVPFHGWVADVYHGSPTSVTAFLAIIPKLTGLALFIRLFQALDPLYLNIAPVLLVLGVISLGFGNLVALVQSNVKRLLGYSAISNMGFVFLALSVVKTLDSASLQPAIFYVLAYALTSAVTFGGLLFLSRRGVDAETLEDLKGLGKQYPGLAFLLLLSLLSMAGIPPMIGFDAKLFVLKALFDQGHLGVMIYALLMSVLAAGYYLRVIKAMYFEEPGLNAFVGSKPVSLMSFNGIVLTLNALALLALGMLPSLFYGLA